MGLYHTKPEERTMLFSRPIEDAYLTPENKEKKYDFGLKREMPEFMKRCLDGVMVGHQK